MNAMIACCVVEHPPATGRGNTLSESFNHAISTTAVFQRLVGISIRNIQHPVNPTNPKIQLQQYRPDHYPVPPPTLFSPKRNNQQGQPIGHSTPLTSRHLPDQNPFPTLSFSISSSFTLSAGRSALASISLLCFWTSSDASLFFGGLSL